MKRKGSRALIVALACALIFAVTPDAFALAPHKVPASSDRIVSLYWKALEISYGADARGGSCPAGALEEQKRVLDELSSLQNELASGIVADMAGGSYDSLKVFSGEYAARHSAERSAFAPVCAQVIETAVRSAAEGNKELCRALGVTADRFAAEYFPGYGYGEPGYNYRKGKEIDSEFLNAYWQDEEKVIETATHFEGAIDFKLGAGLREAPGVTNYRELSAPFNLDIGGHIMLAIKVSFDSSVRITTKNRKKYAQTKVWFELLRRKSGFFGGGEWEACGKTFEMQDLYTKQEVISEISSINQ